MLTAAQSASDRIRDGMSPALAVHVTAREYGCAERVLAARLGRARRRRGVAVVSAPAPRAAGRQWWDD